MIKRALSSLRQSSLLTLMVLFMFIFSAISPPFLHAAENLFYSSDDYSYGIDSEDETPSASSDSSVVSDSASCGLEGVADSVYDNAGGWGLKSALIFSASSAAREYYRSQSDGNAYDLANVFSFTKIPEFWGGLAGDLTFSMIIAAIAPAIPGGVMVQTFAMVGAGFVGYELGSGNIENTDWFSIGMQTLAATITHVGLSALLVGVPFAGLIAGVASIGAALGVAYLISKMRGKGFISHAVTYEDDEKDSSIVYLSGVVHGFSSDDNSSLYKTGNLNIIDLRRERDEAYREYIAASRSGKSLQEITYLLNQYKTCNEELTIAREQASSSVSR